MTIGADQAQIAEWRAIVRAYVQHQAERGLTWEVRQTLREHEFHYRSLIRQAEQAMEVKTDGK